MTTPIPAQETRGDAAALAARLAERGVACRVEGLGALAVLTGDDHAVDALDAEARRWLVQAARACGFTNVAVEFEERESSFADATLPGRELPG